MGGLVLAVLCLAGPARAAVEKPLRVVATIPDLADVIETIGGARVEVTTITRGRENLHTVTPRPSHMVAMNRADAFFQVGLSLESSFVPGLLEGARNKRILPGAPGFVSVSQGWQALDVPDSLSRRGGDLHPEGNPHINLDPAGGLHMARIVRDALIRLDPGSRDEFERRFTGYEERLAEAAKRWSAIAKQLEGQPIVVAHVEFDYLARKLGLEIVGSLEVRPGIPPTPNHLAQLVERMRTRGVRVIVIAPWSASKDVDRVAEATGARIVVLPNQVGGTPGAETWLGMMDLIHTRLEAALAEPQGDSPPKQEQQRTAREEPR